MRHRLGLATRTQISVCKSPFPSADTAVSLLRAKTVQQRPLLPREVDQVVQHVLCDSEFAEACPNYIQMFSKELRSEAALSETDLTILTFYCLRTSFNWSLVTAACLSFNLVVTNINSLQSADGSCYNSH